MLDSQSEKSECTLSERIVSSQPAHELTMAPVVSIHPLPFMAQPGSYIATAASTGLMIMATAWLLFDFFDEPTAQNSISSPEVTTGRAWPDRAGSTRSRV